MPNAGRAVYGDINEYLPRYKQMLSEAGRTFEQVPITLFGGTEDLDVLKRYRDMGVERVVVGCPPEPTDKILPVLDKWAGLMRQVNGLTPVPVADNIINLQFAFDTYNSTTDTLDANQPNPIGVGESPNLIQKINMVVMGQSMASNSGKAQNMYLATSVSAVNMAFRNRYQ